MKTRDNLLDQLDMSDNQAVFDYIVKHLRAQGCKSWGEVSFSSARCAYRGDGGLMCAVGALIPDDIYDYRMECYSILGLMTRQVGKDWYVPLQVWLRHADVNLLARLQNLHDQRDVEDWEFGLKRVAQDFGLTYTPPESN